MPWSTLHVSTGEAGEALSSPCYPPIWDDPAPNFYGVALNLSLPPTFLSRLLTWLRTMTSLPMVSMAVAHRRYVRLMASCNTGCTTGSKGRG